MPVNRSFLYVPADRPERVVKAFRAGADAVLVDLEDAVALTARAEARAQLPRTLADAGHEPRELWVRINHGSEGLADLDAIGPLADRLTGLVLAKCDSVAWLDDVAALVPPRVTLSPLVETARAVRRLDDLLEHERVDQCHLGEIDLAAEVQVADAGSIALIEHVRLEVVVASASAGIQPPIGGVEPRIRDLVALAETSRHLAQLGFAGRPALHPDQVAPINDAFTPSAEVVARSAALVAEYDAALAAGHGVLRAADGSMIDEAVVKQARSIVARFGAAVA